VTQCHKATIALPGDAESLNVAAAGAIALYELSRRPGAPSRA
jgi:tRNA G18 (ribose-2'-O)-methylase SpoU